MPLSIKEEIEAPEGVKLELSGRTVEVSGAKGKLIRTFDFPNLMLRVEGRKVLIETDSTRRTDKAAVNTVKAHLQNMFKGVTNGFVYKLRIVYSHFPITVKVEGKRVLIQNFLGERAPRVARIVGDVNVEVCGDEILVSGADKEEVGQTAFNIEQATFVKYRDLRIFQDGCYIVERT
ncbi:MAG: 50S ribosomal protein L6 [Candidatus Hodarchaeaceae archaeon]|nr:50S ribosomal protein L6 [Candidatus Hodarchaeaceae archaeon]